MCQNILLLVLSILFYLILINGQELTCDYKIDAFGYSCNLKIQNPNELNNFTVINGKHLEGKTNDNVEYISCYYPSKSKNWPAIICEKFINTTRIDIDTVGIENLDRNSFPNCKKL
ncbi:hypothetical protein ACKWTF_001552 [Chironomus riparius]